MTSGSALEDRLYRHLLTIGNLQLAAMDADVDALGILVKGLSEAQVMTKRCMSQGSLTKRTLALARSVASVGRAVANHFIGVERINADVEARRRDDIVAAMQRMRLDDVVCDDKVSPPGTSDDQSTANMKKMKKRIARSSTKGHVLLPSDDNSYETLASDVYVNAKPSHVSQSYEWLIAHLHNPYPPSSIKKKIASESGIPVKTIEDWFTHMRKRIGWTSIVKKFFRGCRAEAVDCAMSVLSGEPPKQPVISEHREALLAMKTAALSLYQSPTDVSDVIRNIEATMKTSIPNVVVDEESTQKTHTGSDGRLSTKSQVAEEVCNTETRGTLLVSRNERASKKRRIDLTGVREDQEEASRRPTCLRKRRRISRDTHSEHESREITSPSSFTLSPVLSYWKHLIMSDSASIAASSDCPQMSRKRRNQNPVEDESPTARRRCSNVHNAQDQTPSCFNINPVAPVSGPSSSDDIKSSASDLRISLNNADPQLGFVSDTPFLFHNWDTTSNNVPRDPHLLESYEETQSASDEALDPIGSSSTLLGAWDLLPNLPDFTLQSSDILPPSTESFSPSSDLFFLSPGFDLDNRVSLDSCSSLVDSPSLSSLDLDFSAQLDFNTVTSNQPGIKPPGDDISSPSDLDRDAEVYRWANMVWP